MCNGCAMLVENLDIRIVTHDSRLDGIADRVLHLEDGKLLSTVG